MSSTMLYPLSESHIMPREDWIGVPSALSTMSAEFSTLRRPAVAVFLHVEVVNMKPLIVELEGGKKPGRGDANYARPYVS
jgi:hypothetical protein